jgi:sulfotransferase family protein
MNRPFRPEAFSLGDSEDRLVWIFGSSRSGSTWLLRMLSMLDGVAPIDDPHLGHHLGVWRPIALAWSAAEHPPDLTTLDRVKHDKDSYFFSDRYRDAWAPALRRLIVDRFDAEARDHLVAAGASTRPAVVVKEPGSHVADHLMTLFPKSRLIFLLRDGRDVVDSWLAAYRPGSWALDEGAFPATPQGRKALVRWQSAVWAFRTDVVQRVYERQPPDRRVLVRYEDLVADPVRELQRIGKVLPIATPRRALAAAAAAHDYERVPPADKGDNKFIRSAQPGGWRGNLTPTERRIMHEVMGAKLVELGYLEPEASPTPAG